MKNIALIAPTSERFKGGIAQFNRYLADRLGETCAVTLFSWFQLYPSFLISRDFRDAVSKTSTGKIQAEFSLGYLFPLSWLRTARKIRKLQPQMIVLAWIHPVHAPIYAFFLAYFRRYIKAEIIFICYNVTPHEAFPGALALSRWVLSRADRLIVHGRSEEEAVHRLTSNVPVTRLFLPLRNFFVANKTSAPQKSSGPQLLFFGMIRHYKGLDVLLRALPAVLEHYPQVHLVIAGEKFYKKRTLLVRLLGSGESDPLSLIDSLGLQHAVTTHVRYIPNEEVPEFFHSSDVAVFPYRSATQSGVVAVAYGYDVPVIASRVGGLPDVIEEGVSGYLVPPEDPKQLAETILRFLDNPIPKSSVHAFAKKLSWERYIDGLLTGASCSVDCAEVQESDSSTRAAQK